MHRSRVGDTVPGTVSRSVGSCWCRKDATHEELKDAAVVVVAAAASTAVVAAMRGRSTALSPRMSFSEDLSVVEVI